MKLYSPLLSDLHYITCVEWDVKLYYLNSTTAHAHTGDSGDVFHFGWFLGLLTKLLKKNCGPIFMKLVGRLDMARDESIGPRPTIFSVYLSFQGPSWSVNNRLTEETAHWLKRGHIAIVAT